MRMTEGFKYNINLPLDVNSLLDQDFWLLDNVHPLMLQSLSDPVKFSACTWIFVKRGECEVDISLISHKIKAPAFVTINTSQIMQPTSFSSDFEASVIVMSKRFQEHLFIFMANTQLSTMFSRHVTVAVPPDVMEKLDSFMHRLHSLLDDKDNPYLSQALVYEMSAFLFGNLYKCYEPFRDEVGTNQGRMSTQFLALVQQNYKKERFLDFYASKLDITSKHLSRTIKSQTGFTAVEWIERFVILEAKVLLKSTNLNIQQIADELNFPSQSFFGKYFKKYTGMSPKEFRNS